MAEKSPIQCAGQSERYPQQEIFLMKLSRIPHLKLCLLHQDHKSQDKLQHKLVLAALLVANLILVEKLVTKGDVHGDRSLLHEINRRFAVKTLALILRGNPHHNSIRNIVQLSDVDRWGGI